MALGESKNSDKYRSFGDAFKSHICSFIFISGLLLMKFDVIEKHPIMLLVVIIAGCVGIFELMASKYPTLEAIGWGVAILWLLIGDRGILSGY